MEIDLDTSTQSHASLSGGEGRDLESERRADCRCETAAELSRNHRWTGERIARLGFLVGKGHDVDQIAADPIVGPMQPNNVYRTVQRFGLGFRLADTDKLPPDVSEKLDAASGKRQITREALIKNLLIVAAREPTLIDNILDDGNE
jgi:hypothetical protein